MRISDRNDHRIIKLVKKILSISLALLTGAVIYICAYITLFGLVDVTTKSDIIVVPGNTVNPDGSLSPRLRARIDKAIELFKDGKGNYLFVGGALGKEGIDES